LIWSSWEILLIDKMFVGLLVIAAIGTLMNILLKEIQRRAIPWQPE
ncbi:MAG: ABC transporter permease, partial [Betaproteobacteria bacterium]|nr:ABC transporter permease [Betaproteobacteria bacterium]